jgi:hypothetical protein
VTRNDIQPAHGGERPHLAFALHGDVAGAHPVGEPAA